MKAALYARVSTDKQETENQLIELRDFCKRSNYEITKEYVDIMSGSKSDREQFTLLFDDASKKKFDIVIFWACDRFTREGAKKTLDYLSRLESYNVAFRSYTEAYIDSAGIFKDVIISLLATLAKQERIRIKERVTSGISAKRKRIENLGQKWKWGKPTLGEEKINLIKELRIKDPKLSIRKISELSGCSLGAVHKTLKILGA